MNSFNIVVVSVEFMKIKKIYNKNKFETKKKNILEIYISEFNI